MTAYLLAPFALLLIAGGILWLFWPGDITQDESRPDGWRGRSSVEPRPQPQFYDQDEEPLDAA